ncbi:trehalose-phosphatase [Solimonas variicoloris]|uniref:trehalose-phosphatase n=1 Tax=Solimonas variicoloris TaxID=254408 RepID=UPI0006859490|nr:trehalose-phosphatase [Solimonas variicoloris]
MSRVPEAALPPLLAPRDALFLDFDGTLAEIAERPELVRVAPELVALIERTQRLLGGALAIVSGRPLRQIDEHLLPLQLPGAGQHGAELRVHGNATPQRRAWPGVAAMAADVVSRFGNDPQLLVEAKGAAVALHYRAAPERAELCQTSMRELAARHGLDVLVGKMVVEARPRGLHKGLAVDALLARPLFAGRRPVFVGDDTTDEDGFRRAAACGGYGIKVGPGASGACYRLDGVAAVHAWLARSADAASRARESAA